jgi:hypothetical protein
MFGLAWPLERGPQKGPPGGGSSSLVATMARFELSPMFSKFMDRHLVFPILEFHQEKGVYDPTDIMQAKLALLKSTNMVDFAMDIYKTQTLRLFCILMLCTMQE